MSLEYLPIMAQAGAPKPPRVLVLPSKQAWIPLAKPLNESKVALLSSAALRLEDQQPFAPRGDLTYRRIRSDPTAGTILIANGSPTAAAHGKRISGRKYCAIVDSAG